MNVAQRGAECVEGKMQCLLAMLCMTEEDATLPAATLHDKDLVVA